MRSPISSSCDWLLVRELSAEDRVLWQELGAMFEALRTVAVFYFRADKSGICDTLQVPTIPFVIFFTLTQWEHQ